MTVMMLGKMVLMMDMVTMVRRQRHDYDHGGDHERDVDHKDCDGNDDTDKNADCVDIHLKEDRICPSWPGPLGACST